jgi:SAM-dependent methyltransferase
MASGSPLATGPSPSAVAGLAAAGAELRAHGYTWPRVRERTGLGWQIPFPLSQLDEVDTPQLADESRPPVDWLIRLLLLGDEIPSERLDAFTGAATRETLVRAELLREHGAAVSAQALVLPFDDLLLACDWPWLDVPSRVTVPDPSSAFTAEHVAPLPGEPAGTAVDVGTGCGIIALVAARHFGRVIGVDTSPRAIEFARFNAALNGVAVAFETCSTRFLAEELEAPVDLVAFVLPVLLPQLWRRSAPAHVSQVDPGVDGKELALEVYRQLPRSLTPLGRALLLHQVPLEPGNDLAAWLRASGAADELAVLANMLYEQSSGFGFVRVSARRAATGSLRIVPGPANLFVGKQSREDLLRSVATDELLAQEGADLSDLVPRLYGGLEATTVRPVAGGRLLPARTTLGGKRLDEAEWALVQALDGKSTVAQLQGRGHAEATIRRFAAAGLVYLER